MGTTGMTEPAAPSPEPPLPLAESGAAAIDAAAAAFVDEAMAAFAEGWQARVAQTWESVAGLPVSEVQRTKRGVRIVSGGWDASAVVAHARLRASVPRLVAELQSILSPHDRLCLDNGLYKLWFARNYRCRFPNTMLLDNALATMGAGLPSAIGARIHDARHKVVAVCGDGGFMMNSQELETAVRLGLDLVVLVLRDDAFGMIKWKQQHEHYPVYGMDTGNPDFVAYAESYGAHGHRIESLESFAPRLRGILDTPGVHVVEVPISYADDDRLLNEDIPKLAAAVE